MPNEVKQSTHKKTDSTCLKQREKQLRTKYQERFKIDDSPENVLSAVMRTRPRKTEVDQ